MKDSNKTLSPNQTKSVYDDGNIPDIDLPQDKCSDEPIAPLPESTRPRKDGPGGE